MFSFQERFCSSLCQKFESAQTPTDMSAISVYRPEILRLPHYGFRNRCKFNRISASWTMTMDYKSSETAKKEDPSIQLLAPSVPQVASLKSRDLKFDRLQPSGLEFVDQAVFEFGKFVAREAVIDEEYWTAAWLRAESHWDGQPNIRYVETFKRKFAEQEFNAIKRRCREQHGQKYSCIVTVRKEEKNIKRTVIKSVVGTLDLSIRYLLHGEAFPGERVMAPSFGCISRTNSNRYGYISNLCVAKSARRQGIASNMLQFAIESAKSDGAEHVFVHVHINNLGAQELYQKIGFEMVGMANSQQLDQTDLLCFRI